MIDVMTDAEAFEIAHPAPSKLTSAIRPSCTFT